MNNQGFVALVGLLIAVCIMVFMMVAISRTFITAVPGNTATTTIPIFLDNVRGSVHSNVSTYQDKIDQAMKPQQP